jgi:uncharacterized protein
VDALLQLRLNEIPEGVSEMAFELTSRDLDLTTADGEFLDPVRVNLTISRQGEQLQIRGTARVGIRQACARCLKEGATDLVALIDTVASSQAARDAGLEVPEGMLYHNGEVLELAGEVRELLLLEVPTVPLCRADCPGLCPHCGADLGVGACGCAAEPHADSRWSALWELREPSKKAKKSRKAKP